MAEQLNCLNTFEELELDIVDLPKMLGVARRAYWADRILHTFSYTNMEIHLLGYYKEELKSLESDQIRSFDTSVPFKPKYGAKFELELPYVF